MQQVGQLNGIRQPRGSAHLFQHVPVLADHPGIYRRDHQTFRSGGKGNGGSHAGSSQKGGKSSAKATKTRTQTKKTTKTAAQVKIQTKAKVAATDELAPNLKGRWNASNANQAALDAHIRNQNFNGTIGALAQMQLAAKAAAGETLNDAELAALESFIGSEEIAVDDSALADLLNADAVDTDPVYSVEDGVVSCTANCDNADVEAAQATADAEAERLQEEAQQAALGGFLEDSEARIVDESNKTLSPDQTETLLDGIAADLGVTRASATTEATAGDTSVEDTGADG